MGVFELPLGHGFFFDFNIASSRARARSLPSSSLAARFASSIPMSGFRLLN